MRYTVTEFDRSTAIDPALNAALADTTLPAPATYVQAMGGLRTGILLPNIMEFANTNKALAKAELVLPISGTYNAFLGPPAQLFIFRRDTSWQGCVPARPARRHRCHQWELFGQRAGPIASTSPATFKGC